MAPSDNTIVEYGDFQTPAELAAAVTARLRSHGVEAASLVEPTCGLGSFLVAGARSFAGLQRVFGLDVNADYVAAARRSVPSAEIITGSFFDHDWAATIGDIPEPVLVLGNPPWVTASGISAIAGSNVPLKSNFQGRRGLDARTGKANFDIAEWMLIRLLQAAEGRRATIAVLIKTAVARKILAHIWSTATPAQRLTIFEIDAARHFGVAAAACLFVCEMGDDPPAASCAVYPALDAGAPSHSIGWENDALVADAAARAATQHLEGRVREGMPRWRSGIKHDCARVMELRAVGSRFFNGLGEAVDVEEGCLFPLLKGSDVANGREPSRWMIVPQRRTGDDTEKLKETAPRTWAYLSAHADLLDRRGSSIYRGRPRFSVFGIGDYSFAPWKVAICGLYKRLEFRVVGPYRGRHVVLDDTSYHLSFEDEGAARETADLLGSDAGSAFFHASIFWDNKRPITAELLNRLDLRRLAAECAGVGDPAAA